MASKNTSDHPTGIPATARCPRGIGLVLLDLDGTLVQGRATISRFAQQTLKDVHDTGCLLVISSGRPYTMMPETVTSLGVIDACICANGAKIYDASGAELFSQTMPREDVQLLFDVLDDLSPRWNVFAEREMWIDRSAITYMAGDRSRMRFFLRQFKRSLMAYVRGGLQQAAGERGRHMVKSVRPVIAAHEQLDKVGCTFSSKERCDRAERRAKALRKFEVVRVWDRELEITARGISKGVATDWLLDHFKIERERTVAFGDSENDASLLGHVGVFVAMGNADPALKERADDVCFSLTNDGVARWLQEQM